MNHLVGGWTTPWKTRVTHLGWTLIPGTHGHQASKPDLSIWEWWFPCSEVTFAATFAATYMGNAPLDRHPMNYYQQLTIRNPRVWESHWLIPNFREIPIIISNQKNFDSNISSNSAWSQFFHNNPNVFSKVIHSIPSPPTGRYPRGGCITEFTHLRQDAKTRRLSGYVVWG